MVAPRSRKCVPSFADLAFRIVLAAAVFGGGTAVFGQKKPTAKPVDPKHAAKMQKGTALFKSQVRALLAEKCLKCHGGQWVKGGFSLATRKSLLESGMVESSADESHLMLLLRHEDEPHMPKDAPRLDDKAIAAIGEWIDLGAPYDKPLANSKDTDGPMVVSDADRKFWSFLPLHASIPQTSREIQDWAVNEIDHFIGRRLLDRSMLPNPRASKRELLRRAYFSLIGLPPTPEQAKAFFEDSRPEAYEQVVDQLLDSPQYGERWARHWMDVARFAESHGYEQDYNRPHAYHYRDFLIRAFNQDMPYDQFVRWQLAGDELAPDTPLAWMATGFLGAGVFPTQLTEAEFESTRYDELDDMTTTTGVAFLGLSVGCARCHDHKFDPIPTRDYYQLAATFTSTIRSELPLEMDRGANRDAKLAHQKEIEALQSKWDKYVAGAARKKFEDWMQAERPEASPWTALDGVMTSSAGGAWKRQADGSYFADYPAPAKETLTFNAGFVGRLAAVRLEALTDESFPHQGPGRADNGNFALGDIRLKVLRGADATVADWSAARATHQQNSESLSVGASIDNDGVSGWAVDGGGIGKDQAAVFDLENPIELGAKDRIELTLRMEHPNTKHTLGRVRLSIGSQPLLDPVTGKSALGRPVLAAIERLRIPGAKSASPDEIQQRKQDEKLAFNAFLGTDADASAIRASLDRLKKQGPKLQKATVQVCSEGVPHMKHHADGRGYPHFYPKTYLLSRGDVKQKQEPVEAGFLQVLASPSYVAADPSDGSTESKTSFRRARLANWLTDPKHGAGHLAARVIVNRLWHHHFGRGLVATPNDFGFQGDRPTHPELLDYLAAELIANDWKLKSIQKKLVMSAVFTQSSAHDSDDAAKDPDNQWWWRRSPRRLEAEPIRDSMLVVAGVLDKKMYGPGTLDVNMRRRSIYFTIKRSQLIPTMMLFDWPEHLVSIGSRSSTTIAPQALMFMNSKQGRQYAAELAKRLPPEQASAISHAYWLAFSREPTAKESQLSKEFLARQARRYDDMEATVADRLAMEDFCQALLSSNEFVYVD